MFMLTTPPSSLLSLSFFLLLSSSTFPTPLASICHKSEAAALLDMKRSFGDPPYFASWDPSLDCCSWDGVRCDRDTGAVTSLNIDSRNVTGPISSSVSNLSSLQVLSISANATGTIPPSIGELASLAFLGIYGNHRLTGTIPRALCNLQNLAHLYLSDNDLYGPIPDCFGKSLAIIDLSLNRLSGPIPDSIMHGVAAGSDPYPRLILAKNKLTGPIPASLGDVPLKFIDLSQNRLSGDASFLLGGKGSLALEEIYLQENELEFNLSKVKFPLQLTVLKLNNNRMYGGIPRQISKLRRLQVLDLSYNDLCGPIPTAGHRMKTFDASSFAHNKCLCGGPLEPCH